MDAQQLSPQQQNPAHQPDSTNNASLCIVMHTQPSYDDEARRLHSTGGLSCDTMEDGVRANLIDTYSCEPDTIQFESTIICSRKHVHLSIDYC